MQFRKNSRRLRNAHTRMPQAGNLHPRLPDPFVTPKAPFRAEPMVTLGMVERAMGEAAREWNRSLVEYCTSDFIVHGFGRVRFRIEIDRRTRAIRSWRVVY
jgi:hypothetical protein